MIRIARKHSHFVFGGLQAGLTSLIAAGIASFPSPTILQFLGHWLWSWLIAWVIMMPVVMLAAPFIRTVSIALTHE
jgi:amino acid transporter